MKNDVVEVGIRAVIPTINGSALFIGSETKTFVIYVEPSIGQAITMVINQVRKERPLTHDLITHIFSGLGVTLERIVINDVDGGTFFARIIIKMENELGTKLIEVDSRPSDALVLALQADQPMYVSRAVHDSVEDVTDILEKLLEQQDEGPDSDEDEDFDPDEDTF